VKSKTIWFICLALILLGAFLINTNAFIGIIILGVSSYTAGAYHIKFRLEREEDEYKNFL